MLTKFVQGTCQTGFDSKNVTKISTPYRILADRWPYDPLALLEVREFCCNVGWSCNDPSELLVKVSMSRPNSLGECGSVLLRPLRRNATDGWGLASREPRSNQNPSISPLHLHFHCQKSQYNNNNICRH